MDRRPGFSDSVVVVTGAASGIGAALTDALLADGASVWSLDVAPVVVDVTRAIECDIGRRQSIDAAVAQLPERIDALFNCAGVPNGGRFSPSEVMAINWLGLRHLSESVIPRMPATSSVTHVASTAGRGWPEHVHQLQELIEASTFEDGQAWVEANADRVGDGYSFSKEAVQWYTMSRSLEILPQLGLRMNSICPGLTNTQLSADFRRGVGAETLDRAIEIAGRPAEPSEMAPAILFLGDHARASYINGVNLNVDRGTGAAHATGAW